MAAIFFLESVDSRHHTVTGHGALLVNLCSFNHSSREMVMAVGMSRQVEVGCHARQLSVGLMPKDPADCVVVKRVCFRPAVVMAVGFTCTFHFLIQDCSHCRVAATLACPQAQAQVVPVLFSRS